MILGHLTGIVEVGRAKLGDLKPGDQFQLLGGSGFVFSFVRKIEEGETPEEEVRNLDSYYSNSELKVLIRGVDSGQYYIHPVSKNIFNVRREEKKDNWWDKENTPLTRLMREKHRKD